MNQITWKRDNTGRWEFAGIVCQIAPQDLKSNAYGAVGWYGRPCHCRAKAEYQGPPEQPWTDPRKTPRGET